MRYGRLIALILGVVSSISWAQSVTARKSISSEHSQAIGALGSWHGAVEMRHHMTTFYDVDGKPARQEPTMHTRMQIGALFYDGVIDFYTTLGVYKRPQTLQIQQRRPEITLDFRPIRSEYFELLQYTTVKLPFQQKDPDPEIKDQEQTDGSIVVIGAAPSIKLPLGRGIVRSDFEFGLEGWTKFYSRKQYLEEEELKEVEEDEGRLSLNVSQRQPPPEDFAPHYDAQTLVGVQIVPFATIPSFKMSLKGHYHATYYPVYTKSDLGIEYEYNVEKYSYFVSKTEYAINSRVSLINEFSAYYDQFFQDQSKGDNRRYRNITRLLCRL